MKAWVLPAIDASYSHVDRVDRRRAGSSDGSYQLDQSGLALPAFKWIRFVQGVPNDKFEGFVFEGNEICWVALGWCVAAELGWCVAAEQKERQLYDSWMDLSDFIGKGSVHYGGEWHVFFTCSIGAPALSHGWKEIHPPPTISKECFSLWGTHLHFLEWFGPSAWVCQICHWDGYARLWSPELGVNMKNGHPFTRYLFLFPHEGNKMILCLLKAFKLFREVIFALHLWIPIYWLIGFKYYWSVG